MPFMFVFIENILGNVVILVFDTANLVWYANPLSPLSISFFCYVIIMMSDK